jgi:hypothetical protein
MRKTGNFGLPTAGTAGGMDLHAPSAAGTFPAAIQLKEEITTMTRTRETGIMAAICAVMLAFCMTAAGCDNGTTPNNNQMFDPGAIPLTHDTFMDGRLTTYVKYNWYTFTGEEKKFYQIQWNSGGSDSYGDGTKTASSVYVTGFTDDGSLLFNAVSNGWTSLPTISPGNKTVFLMVTSANPGTYSIRYFNPAITPPQQAISISTAIGGPFGVSLSWSISNQTGDIEGYRVYRSSAADDEPTQLADVTTSISSYLDTGAAAGTMYHYQVKPWNDRGEGQGSRVVSLTRIAESDIRTLSFDDRVEDEMASTDQVHWYKFDAGTTGKTIDLIWNDRYSGDGTYTGDIIVSAYKIDGSSIFLNQDSAWTAPKTISNASGWVYLMVKSGNYYPGTYSLICTEKP